MKIIANCNQKGCPKEWKKLETSGETHIGLCLECFRKVTLVETIEDLNARTEIDEKAAINSSLLN